jgi:hypothetical protein
LWDFILAPVFEASSSAWEFINSSALVGLAMVVCLAIGSNLQQEEEEGLQGVFKRLRRNGHQLEKGCCEQTCNTTWLQTVRSCFDNSQKLWPEQ